MFLRNLCDNHFTMSACTINGEPRAIEKPLTVTALLADMGLAGRKIAVEQNGVIVPKSRHGEVFVSAGDEIEIVTAVGGG